MCSLNAQGIVNCRKILFGLGCILSMYNTAQRKVVDSVFKVVLVIIYNPLLEFTFPQK